MLHFGDMFSFFFLLEKVGGGCVFVFFACLLFCQVAMEGNNVCVTPPMALIRQWFARSEEERQALFQSPTTSEKARQDICVLESFSQEHSYFVACETNLGLHTLPSLSPVPQKPSQAGGYGVWLPCVMHDAVAYGGRYALASRRERRCEAARRLFEEVCMRTAVALRDYNTRPHLTRPLSQGGQHWHVRAARILVEALVEASVAALHRLGLTDTLETIERELVQTEATDSGGTEKLGGLDIAPKPVGACRAEAHGSLGVWMLLAAHASRRKQVSPSRSLEFTPGAKRPRDDDAHTRWPVLSRPSQDAEVNYWRLLREQFASLSRNELRHGGDSDKEDEAVVMVSHTSPDVIITLADVRFGIAKALRNSGRF